MTRACAALATLTMLLPGSVSSAQTVDMTAHGSDIPETFDPITDEFNHTRLHEMIPMRDGVRLFTVVLIPKNQEDIYGPIKTYQVLEAKDGQNDRNYLVIGPWIHGQSWGDGSTLGKIKLGADTSLHFREGLRQAFWDEHLKGQKPSEPIPPVLAFEMGANRWRRYDSWPPQGKVERSKLYLQPGGGLAFEPPAADAGAGFDEYVSDPAKPVPYRVRPIRPSFTDDDYATWSWWLTNDQRPSGEVLPYRIRMPHASHTFRRGHRIMVHVQSTWFPVYDRNPQTFVDNVMWAEPGDYRKATQRIHHSPDAASYIELLVNTRSDRQ